MKKYLVVLVLALLLSACQNKQAAEAPLDEIKRVEENIEIDIEIDEPSEETTPAIQDEQAAMEAFQALVEEDVSPAELNNFLKEHMTSLGIESANKMLMAYLDRVFSYGGALDKEILNPAYQALCEKTFGDVFDLEALQNSTDQKFVQVIEKIYSNGMSLEKIDGYYVAVIDFDRLLKQYGNEIGEDIGSYIQLLEKLYAQRPSRDCKESMNALAALIVEHEKYIKTYPNSLVLNRVQKQKQTLLENYFIGTASSGNIDSGTGNVKSYILESFENVKQVYPSTELASLIDAFSDQLLMYDTNSDCKLSTVYLKYYKRVFKPQKLTLYEKVIDGHKYPQLSGLSDASLLNEVIERMQMEQWYRYDMSGTQDWTLIQSYEMPYVDEDKISVCFSLDVTRADMPSLTIRDISGHTINLETGLVVRLGDYATKGSSVWVQVLDDIEGIANASHFDLSGIDASWENCYLTETGLVIYKSAEQTGYAADSIQIPMEKVRSWTADQTTE